MFGYDFLRMRRRLIPAPNFLVNLEDFLFAACSATVVFYVTYLKNNGEIRWQTALGFICGLLLYRLIIGEKIVKVGCKICKIVAKILGKILKAVTAPFRLILKIVLKPTRFIFWYSGKEIKNMTGKLKRKFKEMSLVMRKK